MRTAMIVSVLGLHVLAGCSSDDPEPSPAPSGLLEPPLPGAGVQYRMVSELSPGQEIERCKLFVAPPEGLFVRADEVRFTPGSHHVLLYKTPYKEMPAQTQRGVPINGAEVHDCADGAGADWEIDGIVAGSQSMAGDTILGALPEGVAVRVDPGTVLVMNTHYLNASPEPVETEARINLHTTPAAEVKEEAGVLFLYNPFIHVPAGGAASARMGCPIDRDISIPRLQSHMHRRGVGFAANLVRGAGGSAEEIYTSTQWEDVQAGDFSPPLQVKAGDTLDMRCDYQNPAAHDVAQGPTTKDEMCVLVGPYYPRSPTLDDCRDASGFPASTWVGSGASTCGETLGCLAQAQDSSGYFQCVVNSCPGASGAMSSVLRCQMSDGFGACDEACDADGDCAGCVAAACAAEMTACQSAACG